MTLQIAQAQTQIPDVEWSLLWPFIIIAVSGIVLITITSLAPATRSGSFPALFTASSGIAAAAFIPWLVQRVNDQGGEPFSVVAGAISVDNFTLFMTSIICGAVVVTALVFDGYLRREGFGGPEWYALILLSASGGILLVSANDLVLAFVGLEILSIAVYVLAALHLRRSESQEAGMKYFVLGALASAILLYGVALVYGATGSTRLDDISSALFVPGVRGLVPAEHSSMLFVGIAFLLVGFGFKVSAVPFHLWTPDVYQGAPSPVVGFMASVVKVAAFGAFMRVFLYAFAGVRDEWLPIISVLAVLSLGLGSFLAVVQSNIKRMMAYSSITHGGFMLVGLHSAATEFGSDVIGTESVIFYLLAYSIMIVGTFAVISVVGRTGDGNHNIDDYTGLVKTHPLMASLFAILLFAQAGLPLTSGHFAKFRVIAGAATDGEYWLAAVAMLAAVVGAFAYLKVVVAMFMTNASEAGDDTASANGDEASPIVVPAATLVVIGLSAGVTLLLGVVPDIGGDFLFDAASALSLPIR